MARPGDLILVYMLEPQAVGTYFDRKRWPLHITLLPWFSASRDQHSQIKNSLAYVAQSTSAIPVEVGERALFGPLQDIPVNLISNQDNLRKLHQNLLNAIGLMQLPLVNPKYTGADYTAHISQYEDRYANQGDKIMVDSIYLVQLTNPNTCQIIAKFDIRGGNG